MGHQYSIPSALRGKTATSVIVTLPTTDTVCFHVEREWLSEFRICLVPNDFAGETRNVRREDILCFIIGQYDNTFAAIGFGNPHLRAADMGYCHCRLPRDGDVKNFWIFFDRARGWIAVGHGKEPESEKLLIMYRLSPHLHPRLAAMTHAVVSNWTEPVSVKTKGLEAAAVLKKLHKAKKKFDLIGNPVEHRGLTFVCALPAGQPSHDLMCQISTALGNDPVLAGNYALLPADSYHMTVYDFISAEDFEQALEALGSFAAASVTRSQMQRMLFPHQMEKDNEKLYTTLLAMSLEQVGIMQSVSRMSFAMRAIGLTDSCTSLELEPWDDSVCETLENWRSGIAAFSKEFGAKQAGRIVRNFQPADGLGGRRWDKGHYRFHMTIAYLNFPIGKSEESQKALARIRDHVAIMCRNLGPIIMRSPHLCHFTSMAAFNPVTIL